MKSFTPQISWHNRDPILSVDIQNRLFATSDTSVSYRLATSGNDSHVIIWKASINHMFSTGVNTGLPKKTANVSVECLADLTKHQRSVNVVRFSPKPEDNLLAAGDDDCVVYIWKLIDDNIENELKSSDIKTPNVGNKRKEFCLKPNDSSDDNDIQMIDVSDSPLSTTVPDSSVVPNPAFGDEDIATEVWKPYKILRGHIQDVSDICWSPDGQRLITGSVDNVAFVWDVHKGQKLFRVGEHKGFVQGVAWDPLNKYLATLSADRSLRISDPKSGRTLYRVHRMATEADKTSRLFYDDTLRSFCRRLTFTPGGEFLIAPSGILEQTDENSSSDNNEDSNKYINTSYVFERKSINKPSFYLPSKKYTIAVSCCPKLFQLHENIENPSKFCYRIVFAVATQDSVLFYDSQQTMPFAMVSQIHYLRLTDLSWSPDGRMLIVSSTDGFATFITFDSNELGVAYDGPTHNFEESITSTKESTSPVSSGKNGLKPAVILEKTPEVDRHRPPKESTPSIKSFFKPSNETPMQIEVLAKPLVPTQNPNRQTEANSQTTQQQNGLSFPSKNVFKSTNILVPRKKIKLTPVPMPPAQPVETIDLE